MELVKVDAGSGSIENTIEVPTVPATDRGIKFNAAAQELKIMMINFSN